MVSPIRLEFSYALYHVMSRGNSGEDILVDGDRQVFLDLLAELLARYDVICHACCLMGNHYYFFVETPKANRQ